MMYDIKVTDRQACIIADALEFYARVRGGQFQEIVTLFDETSLENKAIASQLLSVTKKLLTGMNPGTSNFRDSITNIAFEIYQVIRNKLHGKKCVKEGRMPCVACDDVHKFGDEPLATISNVE